MDPDGEAAVLRVFHLGRKQPSLVVRYGRPELAREVYGWRDAGKPEEELVGRHSVEQISIEVFELVLCRLVQYPEISSLEKRHNGAFAIRPHGDTKGPTGVHMLVKRLVVNTAR